jgi:hypothetical protein
VTQPLFAAPPTLSDEPTGMRAWLFDEAHTVVTQSTQVHFSQACAHFLTRLLEAQLQERWVRRGFSVRYVHDWRSVESYEASTHPAIIEWGRVSLAHTGHVALALSPRASVFLRVGVTAGVRALRVLRMPIEVVEDLEPVLRTLRR